MYHFFKSCLYGQRQTVSRCLYGDDIRIKQIITNLLTNAVKSTALSIGAVSLSEQAKALENASKNGDRKYIDENHGRFMENYRDITEKIAAAMVGQDTSEDAETVQDEEITPNILVVDDDPMNLKVAERLLGRNNQGKRCPV